MSTLDPFASPAPSPHPSEPAIVMGSNPSEHATNTMVRGGRRPLLHRWPTWAQNTMVIAGTIAIVLVLFFAGFFTANGLNTSRGGGLGTQSSFHQQFGSGSGSGMQNGFPGNGMNGSANGFGGSTGSSSSGTGS